MVLLPCKHCRREIPAGDRVCPHCGQSQYTEWKAVQERVDKNQLARTLLYSRQTLERARSIGIVAGIIGGLITIAVTYFLGIISKNADVFEILILTAWFGFLGGGASFIIGFAAAALYLAIKPAKLLPLPLPEEEPLSPWESGSGAGLPIEVDVQVLGPGELPVPRQPRQSKLPGHAGPTTTINLTFQMGLAGLVCWIAISIALFWWFGAWLANQPVEQSLIMGIAIIVVPGFIIGLIPSMLARLQGKSGTSLPPGPDEGYVAKSQSDTTTTE